MDEGRRNARGGLEKVLDVNLNGVFLCCQAVGREMIKRKKGVL